MSQDFDSPQGKTVGDLGREAAWFAAHTLLAVLILAVIVIGIWSTHPDPDAVGPKQYCTVLALLVPFIGGYFIARTQQNRIAKYIWISGLVFFSLVCVWVLDLPTGNGLCEACANDPVQKLFRTFFSITNGSGLMGGDGMLVGAWIPLAMVGYAIGASYGLDKD
jgi:small basic protein